MEHLQKREELISLYHRTSNQGIPYLHPFWQPVNHDIYFWRSQNNIVYLKLQVFGFKKFANKRFGMTTWKFITGFTTACNWILTWVSSISLYPYKLFPYDWFWYHILTSFGSKQTLITDTVYWSCIRTLCLCTNSANVSILMELTAVYHNTVHTVLYT